MPLDFPSNPSNGQVYNNFYYDSSTNAWRSLGSIYAPNYLKNATFTTSAASTVPLTVQGITSQSGNLQDWKNSSGLSLASIESTGRFLSTAEIRTDGKIVGTTQPNGGSDGGIAVRAPVSGSQTSAYFQFVNNSYTTQYGAISADPNGVMTLSATQVTLPTKTYAPGSVVQVARVRTTARTVFNYNSGSIISDLNIPITPKFANSILVCQWNINYEADYNSVFRGYRDGSLIQTSGFQGYNENDGNNWSGLATVPFDNDIASTPNQTQVQYFVPANSTAATTMQVGITQTSGATSSFYQNRTVSSAGASAYEVMVSTGIVWEIAQ